MHPDNRNGVEAAPADLRRITRVSALPLALLVLPTCAALLFWGLGAGSLGGDEARYAAVLDETRLAGGPLPYRLGGEPYPDKPPLGFLILEASGAVGAPGELAARLPAALAGLATAALLFAFGARWLHPLAGAVAALTYVATPTALSNHALRGGTFDALLVLVLTAALGSWIEGVRRGSQNRLGGMLALVVVATLLKSLVGAVLLAATVAAAESGLAARADPAFRTARALGRGAALAAAGLATIGVWIAVLVAVGIADAPVRLLGWDLVARATRGVDPTHLAPLSTYLVQVGRDFAAALLLAVPALVACGRALRRDSAVAEGRLWIPLVCWPAVALALPAASASRLPWYLLPSYAGLALLLGAGAGRLANDPRRAVRRLAWVAAAAVVLPLVVRSARQVGGRAYVGPIDRLGRMVAALPGARIWVEPGRDLRLRARHDPERPAALGDGDAFYLARMRPQSDGWPVLQAEGECPILLVSRTTFAAAGTPAGDWRVQPLGETPLVVLDGCGGAVAEKLRRRGVRVRPQKDQSDQRQGPALSSPSANSSELAGGAKQAGFDAAAEVTAALIRDGTRPAATP